MMGDVARRSSEGRDSLIKVIIICLCDSRSKSCVGGQGSVLVVREVVEQGGAGLLGLGQRRKGATGLLASRSKGRQAAGGELWAWRPFPAATERDTCSDCWRAALCA